MLDNADLAEINKVFKVYEVRSEGDIDRLYGEPLVEANLFYGALYPHFSKKGRAVQIEYSLGEFIVTISKAPKEMVWINIALLIATIITTTVVGAIISGIPMVDRLEQDPITTLQDGVAVTVDGTAGEIDVSPKES